MNKRGGRLKSLQLHAQAVVLMLARQKLLQEIELLAEFADLRSKSETVQLVAQRQQAGGLQTDDRRLGGDLVLKSGEHALGLAARLLDETRREIGAAAAERALGLRVARRRTRDAHRIARMFENGDRRFGDLGLEMMAEGVDEEHDRAAFSRRGRALRLGRERQDGRLRHGAARRDADPTLDEPGERRQAIMRLDREAHRGPMAREPDRRSAEEAQPQRRGLDLVTLRQIFRLDQRHIDGARTFLLAGLAGDAEVHRRVEPRVGEGLRASALVQRRLEGRDARLGRMSRLPRDAEARAHDALGRLLAVAAVHADGDGLGVIAAGRGNAGIGVADAVSVVGRPVEKGFHEASRSAPLLATFVPGLSSKGFPGLGEIARSGLV